MKSPITGKEMKLVKEPDSKFEFRKEEFEITYHHYLCEDSGERYTDDELDKINQTQVHNLYREKYGIPFPDEIKDIREKYDISASKMSEILGFGANSYRNYETGDIPSVANGRLILAVNHPKDFIKQVMASTHLLSERETNTIIRNAEELLTEQKNNLWETLRTRHIFLYETPNEYSGYTRPNYNKIANIISHFSDNMDLYKTKLNKLLFYTDFAYYKRTGCSMTGITYRAIQMGPVPAEYAKLYDKMSDDNLISVDHVLFTGTGHYGEEINGCTGFNDMLFDKEQREVIDRVVARFAGLDTKQLVNLSHEEQGWIDNQEKKELISYQKFAFDLKNID